MKNKKNSLVTMLFFLSLLCVFLIQSGRATYASGHGCLPNEPDRDGDGVSDKNDSYPDDPTLTGLEIKK